MPSHTNTIFDGVTTYTFIDLVGQIELPNEVTSVERRDGVDDVTIIRHGATGRDFDLVSIDYVPSFSAAATLLALYKALVGTSVTIVQKTVARGTFFVRDVREDGEPRAQTSAVGGVAGKEPHECYQRVRWTLIADT